MHSLPPKLTVRAWAWDCGSAAPLLNRTGAACGLLITLRAAQDFVSHYLPRARNATPNQLFDRAVWVGLGPLLVESVHPLQQMPRWATALQFVIPTGVEGSAVALMEKRKLEAIRPRHFRCGRKRNCRSLPYATPDFLSNLVALANFMRLSLPKAAHVATGQCRVAGNPGTLRSG
jgi:hypothetical protein